jgi:hypothetical protein
MSVGLRPAAARAMSVAVGEGAAARGTPSLPKVPSMISSARIWRWSATGHCRRVRLERNVQGCAGAAEVPLKTAHAAVPFGRPNVSPPGQDLSFKEPVSVCDDFDIAVVAEHEVVLPFAQWVP